MSDSSGGAGGQGARVALVVGNGLYQHAELLKNPVHDAEKIAATLKRLKFDVIEGTDTTIDKLDEKIGEFADRIKGAEIALFFFAGHGLQVAGQNYLVPVDAELDNITQLKRQTLNLNDQLALMSGSARVSVVLLDCCRDNPFMRSLRRSLPSPDRSVVVARGLARVDVSDAGALIAFATSPDDTAHDGEGMNSPFTEALLQHLPAGRQSLTDVMTDVIFTVTTATQGRQVPWYQTSLGRKVFLNPDGSGAKEVETVIFAAALEAPAAPAAIAPSAAEQTGGPVVRPGPMPASDIEPAPRSVSRAWWAWGAVPVVVAGLVLFGVLGGSPPPTSTPSPPSPPQPGMVAIDRLILRVGDINAADRASRDSALADIEIALRRPLPTPQDRLELVTALVRMAADYSMRGLTADGRYHLIYLLNKVDESLWRESGWEAVRADARRACADLAVREKSGNTVVGQQTRQELDRLEATLFPERRAPKRSTVAIHFDSTRYSGGTVTEDQVRAAKSALESLGWNVRKLDPLPPDAAGRQPLVLPKRDQVLYGTDSQKASAVQLALDLRAAGFPVSKEPAWNGSGREESLEALISTPAPGDLWKASPPVAAWCFQRRGPVTDGGSFSIRCHKNAEICARVRNGDKGYFSTNCRFIAFLDRTSIKFRPGGTEDSYWLYGQTPFGEPFPQLTE